MEWINKMETKKILKIKEIYEEFLKIVEITELSKNKWKKEFNLEENEEYRNPFRLYGFNKVIEEVRDNIINQIIVIFNKKYPNINLESKQLEDFFETKIDKWKNKEKGNKIYFEKLIKYLEELESRKELLATQYLLKKSLTLIPSNFRQEGYNKPRKFQAEEIIKNNKLLLYCYNENDTEEVRSLLKLINVILNGVNPAIAEEYGEVGIKHFKNHRLDIEFNTKADVLKVSKVLESELTKQFIEYTKNEIINKLNTDR